MTLELPRASTVESVRFTAQIGVPGVLSGLFKKRGAVVAVTGRIGVEGAAYSLMEGLARKHGPEPFWVSVAGDDTVIVHHPDDIRLVLEGSPERFGSDPEAKRKGMRAFQPEALTISRGDLWRQRRLFAEAVLDTGSAVHRQAGELVAVAAQEAAPLVAALTDGGIDDDAVSAAFQRMTRRVVLGDAAADDEELTELLGDLMAAGNKMPDEPAEGYGKLIRKLEVYVASAQPGSLVALAGDAPEPPGGVASQLVHWLFAMGDTLATNVMRTLAALAAHTAIREEVAETVAGADLSDPAEVAGLELLAGCLMEAMRLWPTTPMFGRVALEDIRFSRGAVVPEGTPFLIVNAFNHRNRDRLGDFADTFAPGAWVDGDAGEDWSFNFFSHGPQGCPGAALATLLGQAVLARLIDRPLTLEGVSMAQGDLPHGLDPARVRVSA